MDLAGSIVLLLVVACLVALAARRLRIPYTVALVAAGLIVGAVRLVQPPALTKELLYAVFLPGLLFESSFQLEAEEFWRNRISILTLAFPAVVVSTVLIAFGLSLALRLTASPMAIGPAFVFASLIAATDAIAVLAVMRHLRAPPRLALLVEGESLLNDGTAAVAFTVALSAVLGSRTGVVALTGDFIYAIVVAAAIGGLIGLVAQRLLAWIDDVMVLITITTTAAYGSFLLAERMHASGVIAVVMAGLVTGTNASQRGMKPEALTALRGFWDYLAFVLNSIVFLLMGFEVEVQPLSRTWPAILIAFALIAIVRTLVTYGVFGTLGRRERIPRNWVPVIAWSGLRGSLAMVLAFSLPQTMPGRELVVDVTVGVVVLSIGIQGLTLAPLMRRVGLRSREIPGLTA